ncbi:1-acyl-sn-glycerol-3-phosphate acyltransferase [Methylotenera sp.]|uniref:lysophospholipid acyltransferase family protein n=1 Tax=Methylotenera sp. TaxID=2051956 RepID=UPI002717CF0E|nr:lysophospholipid acyltransferase family protein [Methylotenera sp.]MDO9206189.1 lysophospholipid acyltransferase family protein [Methylotenera sp.]MDP1523735.1 lysophospholipid acyltransferase family protein [Methylotenera sp.]MDP2230239.1 lysophospholipid acyltransferase family protein [Methylotenera sp.]MDP3140183.1 lysophospholipid acyltransferase family protein [Methylotenera sp.]MDP3308767.1 lysophospholipid acyltransferase family protein [Methylotenera sp.]
MLFLRSLLFFVGQVLTAPIFTLIALLALPLNPITRNDLISGWARSMLWWLKITCNIRHEITGLENIPNSPSIILAKHQSAWETLAFQAIFPTQVYVLKRELLMIPIFGWGLAMSSPIAIDRSAGREALKKLVANGKARLDKGFWVVIFPEGTRKAPGERGKYHIGGAWLATHTQTQVVPVAHNAGEYWAKNSFMKKPGIIQIHIGKPIQTVGIKTDALNHQVEHWIETEMATLSV